MSNKYTNEIINFIENYFSGKVNTHIFIIDLFEVFTSTFPEHNNSEYEIFLNEVKNIATQNMIPGITIIGEKLSFSDTTEIEKKFNLSKLNSFDFEDKIAIAMARRERYHNVPTRPRGDGGIDFLGYKSVPIGTNNIKVVYVGQVKDYPTYEVDDIAIRTFLGSVYAAQYNPAYKEIFSDADIVFKYFYGHSGFNQNAATTAKNCGIIMLSYNDIKEFI